MVNGVTVITWGRPIIISITCRAAFPDVFANFSLLQPWNACACATPMQKSNFRLKVPNHLSIRNSRSKLISWIPKPGQSCSKLGPWMQCRTDFKDPWLSSAICSEHLLTHADYVHRLSERAAEQLWLISWGEASASASVD